MLCLRRYEEGHNLDWFMAELCVAFVEDLPDCRGQLLQTIKECFPQILKVSVIAFETHAASWVWEKPHLSGLKQDVLAANLGRCHSHWSALSACLCKMLKPSDRHLCVMACFYPCARYYGTFTYTQLY